MTGRSRTGQGGFTLLEVLLAITILALMTGLMFGTFSRTARMKRQIEAAQDSIHVARVALLRMSREIEMAYVSDSEPPFSQERRTMFIGTSGDSDELRFSWFGRQRLRADTPEADTSVVMYYLEPDPENGSIVNLMRRETYRLEQTNDARTLPGEAYVLCPNVRRVKFSFYDFRRKEWKESWSTLSADSQAYLPTHVRIWLTVVDERGQEVTYFTSSRIMITEKVAYKAARS